MEFLFLDFLFPGLNFLKLSWYFLSQVNLKDMDIFQKCVVSRDKNAKVSLNIKKKKSVFVLIFGIFLLYNVSLPWHILYDDVLSGYIRSNDSNVEKDEMKKLKEDLEEKEKDNTDLKKKLESMTLKAANE